MNILPPTATSHTLKIIPRYYTEDDLVMTLFNEESKVETDYVIEPVVLDGYMYISFVQGFVNNSNYQIKIHLNNDIVYRGKLFITDQSSNTQDYKITKDVFIYE